MQGGHAGVNAAPGVRYLLALQGWLSDWVISFVGRP